jgi:uncharacterized membrane protein
MNLLTGIAGLSITCFLSKSVVWQLAISAKPLGCQLIYLKTYHICQIQICLEMVSGTYLFSDVYGQDTSEKIRPTMTDSSNECGT